MCVYVCVCRPQLVYRGTNYTSNFTTVTALSSTSVAVLSQSSFTTVAKASNFFLGTVYGSLPPSCVCVCGVASLCVCVCVCVCAGQAFMIGFAKNNASVGQSVTVTIQGALDGFGGLNPGVFPLPHCVCGCRLLFTTPCACVCVCVCW